MNDILAFALGGWEWVVVILAILLLFGAKRIPELARGLGTGIKEFKKATREVTEEIQNATEDSPAPQKNSRSAATGPSAPAETVSQSSAPPKA